MKTVKAVLITLFAAFLVAIGVYLIARLLGSSVEKAETFALIALAVGVLEKPILWTLRRLKVVKK